MPAFLVIEARITEPERFAAHHDVLPTMAGHHLRRGAGMGGEALAFWHSPEYQAVKPLRAGTGEFRVRLADGCEQPTIVEPDNLETGS